MEKEKCKKCRGEGKHRDGTPCKWCKGTGFYTPPPKPKDSEK